MTPSSALDDVSAMEAADPGGMLRQVASGAAQIRSAARLAAEAGLDEAVSGADRPRAVIVAGAGQAGELLAAVCGAGCPVPVLSHHGQNLPGWIGAADLVFAIGDESLQVAEQAVRRGASVVGIGPADSRLAQLAVQHRGLHLPVDVTGPPRTMLWAQLVPMLLVVRRLGLVRLEDEVLEQTAEMLEDLSNRCRPSSEPFVNPGKQAALELARALPMPWGEGPLEKAAAVRFAAQLGDNAKRPCAQPQVGALDVAQAGDPDDFFRDREADAENALHLVVFLDQGQRRPAIAEVARARGIPVTEIKAEGEHPLVRIASMISVCDYVSVYLALALGVDPTPVPALSELRARTA